MFRTVACLLVIVAILTGAAVLGMGILGDGSTETGDVKKFNSTAELKAFLEKSRQAGDTYGGYDTTGTRELAVPGSGKGSGTQAVMPAVALATPAPTYSGDYSTTNVQVRGVDEADFVKNDGEYIYLISGNRLVIVDALPAEKADIISETDLSGRPVEMFLDGNRLVVFSSGQDQSWEKPAGSAAPVPLWREMTRADVYDISDRTSPGLVRSLSFSGTYTDSRMIGDYIYAVTSEPVRWYAHDPVVPLVKDGSGEIVPPVYYFDGPYQSFVYNTISSFDPRNERSPEAETFLIGYGTTLYVSPDNLYIAYQNMIPYQQGDVVRPTLVAQTAMVPRKGGEGTIVHRFGLDQGAISYKATGEVPGHLLNQFSMDEYGDNLRVATTVEGWNPEGSYQYNNVYVLDGSLKTIGKVEYIAPGERIYSTRFIGDRLYMVTFKRVDPFFVIDLSDPADPGILGELKIPGYSDYLHPYDANYIIGIGKDTEANQWGGVSVGGLKLALFDVSDVSDPKLVDKVEIGDAGTDSEALRDHRAFLFDRGKNILVIPVSEVTKVPKVSDREGKTAPYTPGYWQGAYVFGVTPESGFTLKGKVTHNGDESPYSFSSRSGTVRRSLYITNVLATISPTAVVLSDLADPGVTLNTVKIPYDSYPMDYPYRGV